jgi:hypothetical protein
MNLDMASERLRDFFIAAVFNKKTNEYESGEYNKDPRRWYTVPFSEAPQTCPGESTVSAELLRKLDTLAATIYSHREMRNTIVHEIATKLGVNENKRLKDTPRSGIREGPSEHEQEMIIASHKKRVTAELASPMEWYKLLVRASSDAFEYMHHKRAAQFL